MPSKPSPQWLTKASTPETRAGGPALEPEKVLILAQRSVWTRQGVNPQKGRTDEKAG